MSSVSFIEKLLLRLKSGDARSIHLNALPGNFARLDIYDLVNIEPSLHLLFLQNLLTKKEFRFSITIEPGLLNQKSAEEKKIIQKIIKRLNHLDYQEKEEFAEHGYHSFGFGFPLLIKRDPNNPDRILKAPLLIWYLDIQKDTRKNNTWIISRDEQHPLIFNELLQSHFENTEKIKTDDLESLIEDDFLNEVQLNYFCKQLLEKLHIPFNAEENIVTLLPATNKETIENITKEAPWIRWSGVLGLYKMQKQSIIKDVEHLLASRESGAGSQDDNSHIEPFYFDGEVFSPVALDPSQENVLQQLKEHNAIIIQGPPGTGKSQSLTAIITQALLNKQRILVVCEKRTAMEVLYNNLKKENLHHLCVLIEDVYSDRKNIIDNVRSIVENAPQSGIRFRSNEYELARTKFLTLREEINHRINFAAKEIFGDDNWLEVLHKSHLLNENKDILEKANALNKVLRNSNYAFTYEEFIAISEKIKEAHTLFTEVDKEAIEFESLNVSIYSADIETLFSNIKILQKISEDLENKIESNLAQYANKYNKIYTWQDLISLVITFSKKYKYIVNSKENHMLDYTDLMIKVNEYAYFSISEYKLSKTNTDANKMENYLPSVKQIRQICSTILSNENNFEKFFNYQKFVVQQDEKTQAIIFALEKYIENDWNLIFETYYLNQTILKTALEYGIKDDTQKLYDELQQADIALKQKLSEKINFIWNEAVQHSIKTKDLTEIKYLYNQRKNKQFSSKNSLRKIIHQDFEFFTTLFPVLMVNPSVCTSVLPLQENLFDFIIMDEASQLRIEDTYSSLLRGKTKIISGDKHQMPPSNFFGNEVIFWNENEEESGPEDFLAESRSLLEYADDANFRSTYLDYHYRSLHPNLIEFSNHAFYQSRLIPLPEKTNYQAIFYRNTEGMYTNGTNEKEADEIVDFLYAIESRDGEYPGIGIATFNIYQRDLIFDKLYEQAYADQNKNEKLQAFLNKGLFVKNLENIQGDERDIMILSTTFGKDENGKFRQFFGPLTQEKGYQLLNVIITRAKHSLYVFTSVPEITFSAFENELLEKGNKGKSIFYAYLSYVKACSENNEAQKQFIKNCLQKNSPLAGAKKRQQISVLKDLVFNELQKSLGENVQQNYMLGGFILDIILLKDGKPVLFIDFENMQNYDSAVSYRIKLHQDKMVESYNIKTYHLWSYNWWKDASSQIIEIRHLFNTI